MDIQLTEEQELLRSSIQRFLRDQYDFDERRKIVATDEGWSRKHWRCLCRTRALRGTVPGELRRPWWRIACDNDRDAGVRPQPRRRTVFRDGCSRRRSDRGRRLAGAARGVPAEDHGGRVRYGRWPGRKGDHATISTTSPRRRGARGTSFVLSGTKAAVIGAPWADKLIVSARTSGGPRDRDGVSLFVVDRHSANLHLQSFKTDRWSARRRTDADGRRSAGQPVAWYRRRRRRGAGSVP